MDPGWRARSATSRGDHHTRRPDDRVVHAVALLDDFQDDSWLGPVLLAGGERLVHGRVELLAVWLERLDPLAREDAAELGQDEPHAVREPAVALLGGRERAPE